MQRSTPQKSPSSNSASSRFRILAVLGAIGLSAVSYDCGQGSQDGQVQQLAAASSDRDGQLVESEKNMQQCRQVVDGLVKDKKFTRKQLRNVKEEWPQPDEAQCIDIMNKTASNKAIALANLLCISFPHDIDTLTDAMRRGYTELRSVHESRRHILLADPNNNKVRFFDLHGLAGCIPHEYIAVNEDDETIRDLVVQMVDGEYEEIIRDFDLETVCPSDKERDFVEEAGCQAFADLQHRFAETYDFDERRSAICHSLTNWFSIAIDEPQVPPTSTEEDRRFRMKDIYLKALVRSADLSESGHVQEAIIKCFLSGYDHLSDSEPAIK